MAVTLPGFAGESSVSARLPAGMLVVDDHELVRLGLRSLVLAHAAAQSRPIEVLEARSLSEALQVYARHRDSIGLVLLDLHLPDTHGLNGLARFRERHPEAAVVILSGDQDPALMRQALAQGAQAFLPKSGDLQEVIGYVRSLGGLQPLAAPSPTTGEERRVTRRNARGEALSLTERQVQVLDGILAGQSNRSIADAAHLSEGTVKNHVSTLLLLFGARSRAELISQLR